MALLSHRLPFTKMQGAGNDYVYIDATRSVPLCLPELAKAISDRHFGVGGDGLVLIMKSDMADFRMRMFNPDGTEAQMCGNASRCVARYIRDRGISTASSISLETLAGIKLLRVNEDSAGRFLSVTVDMGEPELIPSRIPVRGFEREFAVSLPDGTRYDVSAVSMGNPHGVIFVPKITDRIVLGHGPLLECDEKFPEKANIEFVRVTDCRTVEMRVWERGTGETLACGTGACAATVAAILRGLTGRKVKVKLCGGELEIEWRPSDGHVLMTGPAEFVADGEYLIPDNLLRLMENKNEEYGAS